MNGISSAIGRVFLLGNVLSLALKVFAMKDLVKQMASPEKDLGMMLTCYNRLVA